MVSMEEQGRKREADGMASCGACGWWACQHTHEGVNVHRWE